MQFDSVQQNGVAPTESVTFTITPAEAQTATDALNFLVSDPGDYNVLFNNCAITAEHLLEQAGVQNVPDTAFPSKLIEAMKAKLLGTIDVTAPPSNADSTSGADSSTVRPYSGSGTAAFDSTFGGAYGGDTTTYSMMCAAISCGPPPVGTKIYTK